MNTEATIGHVMAVATAVCAGDTDLAYEVLHELPPDEVANVAVGLAAVVSGLTQVLPGRADPQAGPVVRRQGGMR